MRGQHLYRCADDKKLVKKHYKQFYVDKSDNLCEMDKILNRQKLQTLTEDTESEWHCNY